MTKEEIIKLKRKVEAEGFAPVGIWPEVLRLCELVAEAEREACAKVCERWGKDVRVETWDMAADDCAAAIRARGNT